MGDIRAHGATWAPDGQRIVYARKSSLYSCNADGTDSREIIKLPGVPFSPRFSPDGRRLRFTIRDTEQRTSSLWEVSADGKGLHPVLPDWNKPAQEFGGTWTPNGEYFLFESARDHTQNIWALREGGSWFRKAEHSTDAADCGTAPVQQPDPEPGRKKVVRDRPAAPLRSGPMDSNSQQFSVYLPGVSAGEADFQPKGDWVTYVTHPDLTLWQSTPDGSSTVQLTYAPMQAHMPRWSPDGTHIAFMGSRPGRPWKIFVVSG